MKINRTLYYSPEVEVIQLLASGDIMDVVGASGSPGKPGVIDDDDDDYNF